jgi:hypothetical protein
MKDKKKIIASIEWTICMKVKKRINIIWNDPTFMKKDTENYWAYLAIQVRKIMEELRQNEKARSDWKGKEYSLQFEKTFSQVLEEIDPEELWEVTTSEERNQEIKETGGKLRICKERSEKEIRKLKEKATDEYIKKVRKGMIPT